MPTTTCEGRRTGATKGSFLALSALCGLLIGALLMFQLQPPAGLAAPTGLFLEQTEVALSVFVLLAVGAGRVGSFLRHTMTRLARFMEKPRSSPLVGRFLAGGALAAGTFGFAFWAAADVLGGYNGYTVSFEEHPYLQAVFNASGMWYLHSLDHGTQAALFFTLAVAGFLVLRTGNGIWQAVKDSITLFAAPILASFELALWFFAPDDMTWHVIDALWIGGANDMGWRALDPPGTGPFFFSNWFILMVAILLVASRIPFLGLPPHLLFRDGVAPVGLRPDSDGPETPIHEEEGDEAKQESVDEAGGMDERDGGRLG